MAKVLLTETLDDGEVKAELNCETMELSLLFRDKQEGADETLVIKQSHKLFNMMKMLFDPPERPQKPGEVRLSVRT